MRPFRYGRAYPVLPVAVVVLAIVLAFILHPLWLLLLLLLWL